MRQVFRPLIVALFLAALIVSCTGSTGSEPQDAASSEPIMSSDAAQPADTAQTPDEAVQPDEPAGDVGATADVIGTVTVDGVEYGITETTLCDPYADDVIDVELELQGFGTAPDGSRVQIDVYVQELAGMPFDDVSWAGPEGVYGSPDDATVNVNQGRVTGLADLHHARGDGSSVAVEFDLPIPSDTFACR